VVVPVVYCWLDDLGGWARRLFRGDPRQIHGGTAP